MNRTPSPPFKRSSHIKPFISSYQVTSTPDSYQTSKRIKGLLGYSEHYKGSRFAEKGFLLQNRDYRKARELDLELWNPINKGKYLEKFLKPQKNIQTIRIRIRGKEDWYQRENLKEFWKALWKFHWLNRIRIDFDKQHKESASYFLEIIRYLGPLPKLKDLTVTYDGEEVCPCSTSLLRVGFPDMNLGALRDLAVVKKLVEKTPKFNQLDTIKVVCFPNNLLNRIAFVISKLANLRELDLNYPTDTSLQEILKILDTAVKAPKFEILKLKLQMKEISQICLLKHPLFKAKSLKKIHLSLCFEREMRPGDLNEIWDLLQGMPSLYNLSLWFSCDADDLIAKNLMRTLTEMTSLRKLGISFSYTKALSAKQAGNIIRWIFNKMVFLKELNLRLPEAIDFGGFNGTDIQGLPRLVKASIIFSTRYRQMEEDAWEVIEIFGKCLNLREFDLDIRQTIYDFSGAPRRFFGILGKLKGLQVFKLNASNSSRDISIAPVKGFLEIFGRMRNLQDFSLDLGSSYVESEKGKQEIRRIMSELESNKKYRFFDFGIGLKYALNQNY